MPSWVVVWIRCSIPTLVATISWRCFSSFAESFSLIANASLDVVVAVGTGTGVGAVDSVIMLGCLPLPSISIIHWMVLTVSACSLGVTLKILLRAVSIGLVSLTSCDTGISISAWQLGAGVVATIITSLSFTSQSAIPDGCSSLRTSVAELAAADGLVLWVVGMASEKL